jgi:L-amino acid N-acyltransferase YncA
MCEATIRICGPADIAAITAVYEHAVLKGLATFELIPPDIEEMSARYLAIVSAGYPYLVAVVDGAVIGYAHATAYRPRPAYAATIENSVYVHEDFQGRSMGLALMQRLIVDCATRGFRQMIAVIGDSANHGSIRLHEKLGFRFAGLQKSVGWKRGRWLDTVTMQLSLGDGDVTPPFRSQ